MFEKGEKVKISKKKKAENRLNDMALAEKSCFNKKLKLMGYFVAICRYFLF
jgi:hypothetical protein